MISKLWQQSTVSCQLFPWHSPDTPLAHANPVSCGGLFSVLLDLLDDSTLTRMGYNSRFCHMLHRARSKTNLLWNYEPNLRRCWSKTVTHHRLEQHGLNFESKCGEDSCASGASLSTPIAPSKLPVGNITIEPRFKHSSRVPRLRWQLAMSIEFLHKGQRGLSCTIATSVTCLRRNWDAHHISSQSCVVLTIMVCRWPCASLVLRQLAHFMV